MNMAQLGKSGKIRLSNQASAGVYRRITRSTMYETVFILLAGTGVRNIRIHHECECGIEKSAPRITDRHHEACRVMTNGDHDGRILFLAHH